MGHWNWCYDIAVTRSIKTWHPVQLMSGWRRLRVWWIWRRSWVKPRSIWAISRDKQRGEWGYNARLNQLCGISSPVQYSLAFNLESLIAPDRILHIQQHHTPLYTVAAVRDRPEIIATNGNYHTYHVGAYLGDGLHEGAITSTIQVAELIAKATQVKNEGMILTLIQGHR